MRKKPFHAIAICLSLAFAGVTLAEKEKEADAEPKTPDAETAEAGETKQADKKPPANLKEALERLDLPGVKINVDKWAVDVDGVICLQYGLLELVACTRDSKEHEAIVAVDAKPSHIHTALLLLGAVPGNPAIQKMIQEDENIRFMHIPPRGHPVDVYLVFEDDKENERPIKEFIIAADHHDTFGTEPGPGEEKEPEKFPSHTFLFAGSIIDGEGERPRRYLADLSGHLITLATFGDEVLCLPGFFEHANEALMWQVHGDIMPPIDTKVTLRLRPHRKTEEAPAE